MMIRPGPAELFMGVTIPAFTWPAPPYGWLQRTLEVLVESTELPCGKHVWCGAIAAHANGDIIKVKRLNPETLEVIGEVTSAA
jgi:hypothetical protein